MTADLPQGIPLLIALLGFVVLAVSTRWEPWP